MSEPTRYEYSNGNNYWGHFINPKTQHFAPYGEYVRYEDYARLKAEVDELRLENQAFQRTINEASAHYDNRLAECTRLKAEVERLTADLNKMTKTPDGVDYVEVDVGFWTKSGSRLPQSYSTFWSNEKQVQHATERSPSFIEDLGNGVEKHDLKFRIPPTDK